MTLIYFMTIMIENKLYAVLFNKKHDGKVSIWFVCLLQFVLIHLVFALKVDYAFYASLVLYTIHFLPLLTYKETIKTKIFHYFTVYFLFLFTEFLISLFFIFVSYLFNRDYLFIDDLFKQGSPSYLIVIGVIFLCDFWMVSIVKRKELYKNFNTGIMYILIAVFVFISAMNMLYGGTEKTFLIVSIIYIVLFVIGLCLVSMGYNYLFKRHQENKMNLVRHKVVEEQMKDLKRIDKYYKSIRKRNHDLKNHYLIINQLMNDSIDQANIYIQEILQKYQ